ncbi:hypothetical protein CbC4_1295 [Clostridium botulinum BKT015925]|nr:hypothetical protein CbC4_1295 [Clostridium botulinum BKT015925]
MKYIESLVLFVISKYSCGFGAKLLPPQTHIGHIVFIQQHLTFVSI